MTLTNTNFVPGTRAITSVRDLVPMAQADTIYLFQGDSKVLATAMQEIIDRFAIQETVQVVVGANRISFDRLPLMLGDQAGRAYEILDHILVSRAESCYQMLDVLTALPLSPAPLVITDMLASFYEEDLTLNEVSQQLQRCLTRLDQLSKLAPVLVSARSDPVRPSLIRLLEQHANTRFYFQPLEQQPQTRQAAFEWME
ncbi:MAG: hypothetical protein WD740_06795 [Anaerolineales bacterium]